jgi:hypothetical protein
MPTGGTKLKIKNVLSTIFSHGVRWELVERNPVCGQGGSPAIAVLQRAFAKAEDWILPVRIIMARLHTPIKFSSVVTSVP